MTVGLAFPKPKRRPSRRHRERAKRRVVNPLVDARDGFVCQCCLRPCDPDLPLTYPRSWHRHHILLRSACGAETTANKVGICGACHSGVHAKKIAIVGTDADAGVTFIPASTRHRDYGYTVHSTAVSDSTQEDR